MQVTVNVWAIANAFYKDSKIYFFDDATSKMNPELEKDIIDESIV
jgi:ABC-type multidrug transport system fused ATPase/permease subunit